MEVISDNQMSGTIQKLRLVLIEHNEHKGIQNLIRDLNRLYVTTPSLYMGDSNSNLFEWTLHIQIVVIAFIRWDDSHNDHLIVIAHLTPIFRESYRIGVPLVAFIKKLNTDAKEYAGLGFGNQGGVDTEAIAWDAEGNPCA